MVPGLLWLILVGLTSPCYAGVKKHEPGFDPAPVEIPTVQQKGLRPITSADLLTLRDINGVGISPNGEYVAVVIGQAVYEQNSYRTGLLVVPSSASGKVANLGSAGLPLWDVINQWVPESPQWSPDSRHLTCRARMNPGETIQVWEWKRDGGPPIALTHVPGDVMKYEWLKDGSGLLLTVRRPTDEAVIKDLSERGIHYDGSFPIWERQSLVDAVLQWKPPDDEVWLHRFATGDDAKATEAQIKAFGGWQSDLKDKVMSRPEGYDETHHILDAKISPDGSKVVYRFIVDDPAQSSQLAYVLYVKPVRGGTPVRLTSFTSFVFDYWWAQDGTQIYYSESRGDGRGPQLMSVPAGGGSSVQVLSHAGYSDQFSPDRSGRLVAFTEQNGVTPPELAIADLSSNTVRIILNPNPEFKNIRLSSVTRREGKNCFGDHWFGHLVLPLDYEKGNRYPLIVTTYRSGDYFLRGASGDESPIQVYAANGFAVLSLDAGRIPNARNFQDFLMMWKSPVASAKAAIQQLVSEGVADPKRVGITGYSFGSTIVGYALSHTDLFQAAVGAGSYDPVFYYLTDNNFREEFRKWELGGWPEGDSRKRWQDIALTLRANYVHAPILNNSGAFEGLGDLPLFVALREFKRPCDMFIYPNELHHKNQPKHRYEIYQRNLDWFRFWLENEEDQDPAKRNQYSEWRFLRQEQVIVDSEHR